LLTKFDFKKQEYVKLDLDMFQILSVCSLLCSSDVIAAISMINYNDQPKLFSIIYGEGVFNDIVSIILFNTVQSFKTDFSFTPTTPFAILGQFILLAIYSVGIGVFTGIISSLMFKWFRFLTHSAVTETLLIFIISLMTYYASEALELSGMISLLTAGITMAHYTWYNLSPQGKTISSVAVTIFGAASESIVFAYIGLCVFTYAGDAQVGEQDQHIWSLSFILWMTGIVIVGRIVGVWSAHFLFRMCQKTPDITIRELCFISYGGMIRGAIAFGLVLKIPNEPEVFTERGVIVTTTLALVIITTVVFGTFMNFA
jgi:sodium/hydrogen exchanger-like protein 6/7/sodium/hydrogen exchanger 8